jgi:hypothetical protein
METVQFFETNKELLNAPGNSFDVHPFGLELRTEHAEKAQDFGVLISPVALQKDFIVGVGDDWTNTRGMAPGQAAGEVSKADTKLRSLFVDFHRGPQSVWPGFEEYAVLYSDYYSRRPFPFRSSLPDDDGLNRYRVRWHPGAVIADSEGGTVQLVSRFGSVAVAEQMMDGIDAMSGYALSAVLETAVRTGRPGEQEAIRQNFRAVLERLLAEGILQLVPVQAAAAGSQDSWGREA